MFSPQKDSAAATIQKIYRGYCLRRELQGLTLTAARWHEILEFIRAHMLSNQQLQKDISKSERARRRWQKAIFFSARLGRGILDGDADSALLLKTEHWLESVDIEHRYGSNLRAYHDHWKVKEDTDQNFFYWLDFGKGRTLDLPECPRSKLDSQKLVYCSLEEREKFRVTVDPETRLLVYANSGLPVHTFPEPQPELAPDGAHADSIGSNGADQQKAPKGFKFIYVISPAGNLYIHRKIRGRFQHSSFLAGQSVWGAGGIEVDQGRLLKVTLHSGHYRPTVKHLDRFIEYLKAQGVELDHVVRETFKNKAMKGTEPKV